MASKTKLKPPIGISVDFAPSPKQFEVWKSLQAECPECGGEIVMKENGIDDHGNMSYIPVCSKCGLENIPKMILAGGSAGKMSARSI